MSVQCEEERDEEVVRVPEGLKGLLADPRMRCCVHHEHAEQHDVARDATGLGIVNLQGADGANLGPLNVEEVDVVCRGVADGKEQDRVSQLPVHPQVLV